MFFLLSLLLFTRSYFFGNFDLQSAWNILNSLRFIPRTVKWIGARNILWTNILSPSHASYFGWSQNCKRKIARSRNRKKRERILNFLQLIIRVSVSEREEEETWPDWVKKRELRNEPRDQCTCRDSSLLRHTAIIIIFTRAITQRWLWEQVS